MFIFLCHFWTNLEFCGIGSFLFVHEKNDIKMFSKVEIMYFCCKKVLSYTAQILAIYMHSVAWPIAPKIKNLTVLESLEYVDNEKNIFETYW